MVSKSKCGKRKCHECGQDIWFEKKNITGIIYYKNYYYHLDCFCELAKQKSNSGKYKAQEWKGALDNIGELEKRTKELIGDRTAHKDETDILNDYLISQYSFIKFPNRFWENVVNLSKGIYKRRRCMSVPIVTLLEAWKWMQPKLNDINRYNKVNNRGPADDEQRLSYDFAIVVKNIPNYLDYKTKNEMEEMERKMRCRENINIDYNKIKSVNTNNGLDDISDLLDNLI